LAADNLQLRINEDLQAYDLWCEITGLLLHFVT